MLWLTLLLACENVGDTSGDDVHTSTSDTESLASQGDAPVPDALPEGIETEAGEFHSSQACELCHLAESGSDALTDAAGRDISPVTLWSSTMMANSARDPYYLAAFSHEHAANPQGEEVIDATCTRCHAGAGHESTDGTLGYADLLTSEADEAHLGRDGVTCSLCHQISDENLGEESSFTGGYVIGEDRLIYGPHDAPFTHPMQEHVDYTPTESSHVLDSAACATCHTVITKALDVDGQMSGATFYEQAPYLEWLNSDYVDSTTCQDCHVPQVDEDGEVISARISTRPENPDRIEERSPLGRHIFIGGNAYMLDLLAEESDWANPRASAAAMAESADLSEAYLSEAASVSLSVSSADGTDTIVVTVDNLTGHKLPTAYPTRRMVLQLTVTDASGAVVWQSGGLDDEGNLVDGDGVRLDAVDTLLPHHDTIDSTAQAQVYGTQYVDASGELTHVLLDAAAYVRDNRLLPAGWSSSGAWAEVTAPVGVDGDDSFVAGGDQVTYRVPSGGSSVTASLVYQVLPPVNTEGLATHQTPMVEALEAMRIATPDTGRVIATATSSL